MKSSTSRQKAFFEFLLKILFVLFTLFLVPRTIQQDYQTSIALVFGISIVSTLYLLHLKKFNLNKLSFLLNFGMFVLFVGYPYMKSCEELSYIWLLAIPMIGYTLISLRQAMLFSIAGFFMMFVLFYIFNDNFLFNEKFRLAIFYVLLTTIIHFFASKLDSALLELQDYNNNLEGKVKELLKTSKEREKLLIQTSKMASLGEILSSIAHQWKQPLAAISAVSMKLVINENVSETPNENTLKHAEDIQNNVQFMSSTMDDFRSFFQARDEKKIFQLSLSSRKLIGMFIKNFKSHNIEIVLHENSPESIEVFGYENMYKQAILNLIVNARDEIKEKNPQNPTIDIKLDKDDSFGIISIENYAGNIPKDIMDQIFVKNFTTKGNNGSGIGLAMTKEIIEDFSNGKIEVENTDFGVIFTLFIPLNRKS